MAKTSENAELRMKLVYRLRDELQEDPEQVRLAQELTLDESSSLAGLKGTFGLFGSEEWWENVNQKKLPLVRVSGIISELYVEGQDESEDAHGMDLTLGDGSVHSESIYVNNQDDMELFRIGCKVDIVYVLEELKQQPADDGGINYTDIPLEMAVSLSPVR